MRYAWWRLKRGYWTFISYVYGHYFEWSQWTKWLP